MKLRPVALFATLTAALGLSTVGCSPTTQRPIPEQSTLTTKDALQDEMRLLWTQHAAWTRTLLVESLADGSSTPYAKVRLREIHADLGDALGPYFGDEAADELTDYLEAESAAAIAVFEAAKSEDAAAEAVLEWRARARDFAQLLANQSSTWSEEDFVTLLNAHIDATLDQVSARLEGDWVRDLAALDALEDRNLEIADAVTAGLAQDFPELVAPARRDAEEASMHLLLRALWQERAILTRSYVVSATAGLPDASYVMERLAENGDEIAIALVADPGLRDAASNVLRRQSNGVASVTDALIDQDPTSVDDASASFHENAYEISEILARAGDASQLQLAGQLQTHADSTIAQADARVQGDWASDVSAFDDLEARAVTIADLLSAAAD